MKVVTPAVFRTGSKGTPLFIKKTKNEFLYNIGFLYTRRDGSTVKCPIRFGILGFKSETPVFVCRRDDAIGDSLFIKSKFFRSAVFCFLVLFLILEIF